MVAVIGLFLGVLCALLLFGVSERFRQRYGHPPGGVRSSVWAELGLLGTFISVAVYLVVYGLSRRRAADRRDSPQNALPISASQAAVVRQLLAQEGIAVAPPQWQGDPTGRHQLRYWDGYKWTASVADGGVAAVDADLR